MNAHAAAKVIAEAVQGSGSQGGAEAAFVKLHNPSPSDAIDVSLWSVSTGSTTFQLPAGAWGAGIGCGGALQKGDETCGEQALCRTDLAAICI